MKNPMAKFSGELRCEIVTRAIEVGGDACLACLVSRDLDEQILQGDFHQIVQIIPLFTCDKLPNHTWVIVQISKETERRYYEYVAHTRYAPNLDAFIAQHGPLIAQAWEHNR